MVMARRATPMTYVPSQAQADDFMLLDYKHVLDDDHDSPDAVADVEWLLLTATGLVEDEARRLGISECHLLQRRHEVESIRVQRALDILAYGGFIAPDPTD
jgi:hypothetical protein